MKGEWRHRGKPPAVDDGRRLQSILRAVLLALAIYAAPGWGFSIDKSEVAADTPYVGSPTCIKCHPDKASALSTPMGRALAAPRDADILRKHPRLTFRSGTYSYEVLTTTAGSTFTATDGNRSISAPILWAVGNGVGGVGQTYIFQYGGHYFESQVSFYAATQDLDMTMGHIAPPPHFLEGALGYELSAAALARCLQCHATPAVQGESDAGGQIVPGIGCERCHGPGAGHIAAVKARNVSDLRIANPARSAAGDINDFCGSCHRTAQDQKQLSVRGRPNVRFQGYRLSRSRGYNRDDARIACTACHDPHQRLDEIASHYDARCVTCHDGRSAGTHSCPVSTHGCATCHMPKIEIAAAHAVFTDHWIRIAKPDDPYPE